MGETMIPKRNAWALPPPNLIATSAEVHVWRMALNVSLASVRECAKTLAPDERARAARFVRDRDRARFVVARGGLRAILARYLGRDPCGLRFEYGPFGKPVLSGASRGSDIRFNVSHADDMALYAVTSRREVGVDIERVRPDVAPDDIAERFFSRQEVATLRDLPVPRRLEAFFACWTRKEAFIKARGQGLSLALDGFDVSLTPGRPPALLRVHDDPEEGARWSLRALYPSPDHAAALAVEGHDWRLRCWQWPQPGFVTNPS
jgi:4'-phosphopantetheinyl transferase